MKKFKDTISEYTFITRLVNDAKDELEKKFPGKKIQFIKMNDYDISKAKVERIEKKDWTILYIEYKKIIAFDVDNRT